MGKQRNRFVGNSNKKDKKIGAKRFQGIRYAAEEGEVYAVITKIYGGAQCEVMCADGITRRCIVRGKFRGRQKRHNLIEVSTLVLVGVRDWGNSSDSKQLCDLLTVYNSSEKETLKKSGNNNIINLFSKHLSQNSDSNPTDDTIFIEEDEVNSELEALIAEEATKKFIASNETKDIFVDDI